MSDMFQQDWFHPPTPQVSAPRPRSKVPKLLPDVQELYTLQRDLIKCLHAADELEDSKEVHALRHQLENSYRVIRRYLIEYDGR